MPDYTIYSKREQLKKNKAPKFKGGSFNEPNSYFGFLRTYKNRCVVCDSLGDIHHIDFQNKLKNGKNDKRVVMLCHNHHQGVEGIHTIGAKKWYERYKTFEELDKIAEENFNEWKQWRKEKGLKWDY